MAERHRGFEMLCLVLCELSDLQDFRFSTLQRGAYASLKQARRTRPVMKYYRTPVDMKVVTLVAKHHRTQMCITLAFLLEAMIEPVVIPVPFSAEEMFEQHKKSCFGNCKSRVSDRKFLAARGDPEPYYR